MSISPLSQSENAAFTRIPPSTRPFTVITFGDSTTALREGIDVYTNQLRERLHSESPAIVFLNQGIGGNTTTQARERFETDVLKEEPNLVIIQFGINDSTIDVWKTPPAEVSRVSLRDYEENLRFFIERIHRQGGSAFLMTPNPMRWTALFEEKYGKPPYDLNDEMGFTFILEKYAKAMRRIARAGQVPLIDIYELYAEWEQTHGESCLRLLSDGCHPNTLGHTLVTDALEPLIRKSITEAKARRGLKPSFS